MPELAPVTIAFWPLSSSRLSTFGTTGFGRSTKLFCEYGTLGLGRLAASGGIVGMVFSFFVLRIRRDCMRFLTKHSGQELLERRAERAVSYNTTGSPSLAIVRSSRSTVCSFNSEFGTATDF